MLKNIYTKLAAVAFVVVSLMALTLSLLDRSGSMAANASPESLAHNPPRPALATSGAATSPASDSSASDSATAQESAASPAGVARAVLDHDFHNFGLLDVGQTGEHCFTIRNEGTAPLQVRSGGTSCQCTLLAAPDGSIPPGESRQMQVQWSSDKPKANFRHGAVLYTNDPDNTVMRVVVEGSIRAYAAHSPGMVTFNNILRSDTRTKTLLVYSQVWDRFEIGQIECDAKCVSWQMRQADAATCRSLGATAAWEIDVTLAPGLELGTHVVPLRLWLDPPSTDATVEPAAESEIASEAMPRPDDTARQFDLPTLADLDALVPERRMIEVPIHCELVGEFSIFGRNVVGNRLRLGPVHRSLGATDTLQLYVRGPQADAEILAIRSEPSWLEVSLERVSDESVSTVRYAVHVTVPPNAPGADFTNQRAARVELETAHPLWPTVQFLVDFATIDQ